jgi:hypothetical protein
MNQSPSWVVEIYSTTQGIFGFYRTRKLVAMPTRAPPPEIVPSWVRCIQSSPIHPISLRPILILSYHLRLGLPKGLFPLGFTTKRLNVSSPMRATCSAHLILLYFIILMTMMMVITMIIIRLRIRTGSLEEYKTSGFKYTGICDTFLIFLQPG